MTVGFEVRTVGAKSNRDGLGARIRIVTPSGREQWNHVTTAVGYASASEPVAHFGVGRGEPGPDRYVHWLVLGVRDPGHAEQQTCSKYR